MIIETKNETCQADKKLNLMQQISKKYVILADPFQLNLATLCPKRVLFTLLN
jgi:hypothetical protein